LPPKVTVEGVANYVVDLIQCCCRGIAHKKIALT